jgi:hypothetical protein
MWIFILKTSNTGQRTVPFAAMYTVAMETWHGAICICRWRIMLAALQYQPRLSSITNVAPGGSANQIAVLNYIIVEDMSKHKQLVY